MAKMRLNDTSAIANRPYNGEASHSISTRKIDNGWLVETSYCDPQTGEYRHSSQFSATQPRLIPGRAARVGGNPDGGSSLRGAVDYMKSRD